MLDLFHQKYGKILINQLPVIMKEYTVDHPLKNLLNQTTEHPEHFYQHLDDFHSLFDAAALGQFLSGIDASQGSSHPPGYINERALFNPSHLEISWVLDTQGRKVPYVSYKGASYRINNLHIHSKQLHLFRSK